MTQPTPEDHETRRLAALRAYDILDTPPEEEFDDIVAFAAEAFGTPIALISLIDAGRQWFKARIGLEAEQTPREIAFCAHALAGDDLLLVPDALADARFADNPLVRGEPHIRFYAGAPLINPEGHALGTLCVIDRAPRTFDDRERRMLRFLGQQVMTRLELRRQLAETREKEAALRASEARLRAIFECEAECVKVVGADGTLLEMNPAGLRMVEAGGNEDVVGCPVLSLIHPGDRERFDALQREVLLGKSGELQFRIIGRNGTERWVETHSTPLREADGRISAVLSVTRDVTARLKDEEALRRSEEEQRQLARQVEIERRRLAEAQRVARMGSWETDIATRTVAWSEETHRIFGTDPASFLPTHEAFLERVHPEDREAVDDAFIRSLNRSEPQTIEHRALMPDQGIKHIKERWQVFHDDAGRAVRALGTCQDITEQKVAEAELRRTTRLLHAVADNIPDAVFVKDLEGRYLLFNEGAARLVGHRVEEVLGRDDTAIFGPEDIRVIRQHDEMVLRTNRPQTTEERLTAAGVTRYYLATKAPYHDEKGNIVGMVGISRDVTERREAEEKVRALAERLTNTLESLTDGFFTLDRDWRFTFVNGEAERMFRRTRAELLGQPIWAMFPEARGTVSQHEYERAMREKVPVQFETFYPPLEAWFDARAFPAEQGLSVYFRDITATRRAQEALRDSEVRFREMAENIGDIFYSYEPSTNRLLYANPAYERIWGRPLEHISANPVGYLDDVHPDDRAAAEDAFRRQLAGERTRVEFRVLRPDGSIRWVHEQGVPILDAAGRVDRIVGTMKDVTENRLAVEKLREQAALLDKAQDAILVRDLEHRILYWNRSAERLYGWTSAEVAGRSIRELLYRDPAAFDAATGAAFEKGEWVGEIEQVTKDGRQIAVEGRWTLVRDDAGRPRSILAINTDITEKKKLEQQFLRAQRLESIGTLAGGIAHDLNNVLAPILMSIDLLRMDLAEDERLAILGTIESSARRGADMVGQVLSFARGVSGRQIEIQARHLVRDIVKIVNETFSKDIRVETSLPHDLWTLVGDPTQLHQVLLNLCINARDAMPRGGTLSLSAENKLLDAHYAGLEANARPGPHVMLQIEDSGTGIPPEILDKIFDPFFTTKEPGKGTGLGLSTSLAIVKSHGGFIRVYSEPGRGTRFRIYLPATDRQSAAEAVAAPELPRGHGELVLVVDDEASVRQITRQTLEAFGYRVLLASDGAEAVAIYAAERERVAVVLTDMMMPVMDGPATIQVLLRMNPKVRIIAASGLNANGRVAKAANAGARHFLPKPYTAEALLTALRNVLRETA